MTGLAVRGSTRRDAFGGLRHRVWLMFTRLIFGTQRAMADSDHLMGSLVITVSVLAMAEVARAAKQYAIRANYSSA